MSDWLTDLQAFGSVAPMEAAFFCTFGKQQLLSEQFLMDCSWAYGNTACLGGYQDYGLSFAVNSRECPAARRPARHTSAAAAGPLFCLGLGVYSTSSVVHPPHLP